MDPGFSGGSSGKESACNVGDPGSISGLERSPGEGNGYPLQYSCLENPMDRGACGLYSPWGRKELDTTEQITLSLSLGWTPLDLLMGWIWGMEERQECLDWGSDGWCCPQRQAVWAWGRSRSHRPPAVSRAIENPPLAQLKCLVLLTNTGPASDKPTSPPIPQEEPETLRRN